MIKHHLITAYRNLSRQKLYTIINIVGLSVGLACTIIIGLYVVNEYSFDRFHTKSDRIYRITLTGKIGTNSFNGPVSSSPMAKTLKDEFHEVELAVRLFPVENSCILANNLSYYEDRFLYADSTFFEMFDFKFIQGTSSSALSDRNSIIINKSTAEKYFGNADPIGKTVCNLNNDSFIFKISGVIEDMPKNSHFHFDFIANSKALHDADNPYWINANNFTYIALKEGFDYKETEKKLPSLVTKYVLPQIQQFYGIDASKISQTGTEYNFHLQKLTDIHLKSGMDYELEAGSNKTYINIFILVAIFIIIIACINFMNLSTVRSLNRTKEVGVRKTMGASRKQVLNQFLIETILICLIAFILALFLCEVILPILNKTFNFNINFSLIFNEFLLPIIILSVIAGIFAGTYPAFFITGFNPIENLKNNVGKKSWNNLIRRTLVILQFTISITILLCTYTIYRQLNYVQNKTLGYDADEIVIIERTAPLNTSINQFVKDLKSTPLIKDVALSTSVPGRPYLSSGFIMDGKNEKRTYYFSFLFTDYNYLKVMGMKLLKGRSFSEMQKSDSNAIIINETAAKYLSVQNTIGLRLISPAPEETTRPYFTIIGIVKDFHYEDFHKPIRPVIIMPTNYFRDSYISVRITSGRKTETINYINAVWKKYSPDIPLKYFYFNKEFEKLYKSEQRIKLTMTVFSILSIIIACMGLFALIAFITEKRTKEIGIRKILGSSIPGIIKLLTSETTYLIIISSILSIAVSAFIMNIWLNTFAYHTELNYIAFVGTCIFAYLIALSAIFFQAYSAARKNPAKAIRYD